MARSRLEAWEAGTRERCALDLKKRRAIQAA